MIALEVDVFDVLSMSGEHQLRLTSKVFCVQNSPNFNKDNCFLFTIEARLRLGIYTPMKLCSEIRLSPLVDDDF